MTLLIWFMLADLAALFLVMCYQAGYAAGLASNPKEH